MKKVFIDNISSWKLPDNLSRIKKNIQKVLDFVSELSSYEISVLIVSDKEIQLYNREKRGKNKPTDVLSFPIAENFFSPHKILGQIVISYETLIRQAKVISHSEKEEFYRLLIHGILHLLGYDHEKSLEEEKKMQDLEDKCWDIIFEE